VSTLRPVDAMNFAVIGFFDTMGAGRAGFETGPAADAAGGVKLKLAPHGEGLGVMTPGAAVAAAHEKDRRPYARPVMNREPLYIEYQTPDAHMRCI